MVTRPSGEMPTRSGNMPATRGKKLQYCFGNYSMSMTNLVQTRRRGFFTTAICRPYGGHFAGLNRTPWGGRQKWRCAHCLHSHDVTRALGERRPDHGTGPAEICPIVEKDFFGDVAVAALSPTAPAERAQAPRILSRSGETPTWRRRRGCCDRQLQRWKFNNERQPQHV